MRDTIGFVCSLYCSMCFLVYLSHHVKEGMSYYCPRLSSHSYLRKKDNELGDSTNVIVHTRNKAHAHVFGSTMRRSRCWALCGDVVQVFLLSFGPLDGVLDIHVVTSVDVSPRLSTSSIHGYTRTSGSIHGWSSPANLVTGSPRPSLEKGTRSLGANSNISELII
jgi:hypothetical protein